MSYTEIKLKHKIVFDESSESLSELMIYKFATKAELKKYEIDYDLGTSIDNYTNSDSEDIPIEEMKAMIKKAEDAGANFISIDYHCDHGEYDVYGSILTRVSDGELLKEKKAKAIAKKLANKVKISNLEKEIENLKKE